MPKEERDRLKSRHPNPKNCILTGPKLNLELALVVPSFCRDKDDELRRIQDHVSVVLSTLGSVITDVLDEKKPVDRKVILRDLSDAGRYLSGTHYSLSLARRKQVKFNIRDIDMKTLLQESAIYPMLFGSDLSTQVKTAHALAKTGREIAGTKAVQSTIGTFHNKPHQESFYKKKSDTKSSKENTNAKESLNSKSPHPSYRQKTVTHHRRGSGRYQPYKGPRRN